MPSVFTISVFYDIIYNVKEGTEEVYVIYYRRYSHSYRYSETYF